MRRLFLLCSLLLALSMRPAACAGQARPSALARPLFVFDRKAKNFTFGTVEPNAPSIRCARLGLDVKTSMGRPYGRMDRRE